MSAENLPAPAFPAGYHPGESFAREMDRKDPFSGSRGRFHIPIQPNGREAVYLAGNSLGLMPKNVTEYINEELEHWAKLGVDAHFGGRRPWYSYHKLFRDCGARLVGAEPGEVVLMNSLTVNLHLMMETFFRPTPSRYKVLMEDAAFPSDTYAVKTQLRRHKIDPRQGLIVLRPRQGESTLRTADILGAIAEQGEKIALVLMGGVNYFTGQAFEMAAITAAAKEKGCVVGWDLAHAAGNLELRLHEWDVDFAVWCNYKYLNCGPGAIGGCFVNETHALNSGLPRLGGWWGNDPGTRFRMHLEPEFVPLASAEGWQISNPPILSAAPAAVSYAMFDETGMAALRAKSLLLTGYLFRLIEGLSTTRFEVITPADGNQRGCQVSLLVRDRPMELFDALRAGGVVGDFRKPDVIRVAPVPMYNTFHDVWAFVQILKEHTGL